MSDFWAKEIRARGSLWAAGLFAVALLLLYGQTALSMISIWSRSDTFAHGFLILPIALWLVWIKRDYFAALRPRPAPAVSLLLIPGGLVWLLAWLVDVLVVQQLALVGMLVVGVWSVLGHRFAGLLAFPLAFLFFAVPMGEGLIAPMMDFTAVSTVWLIQQSGIPVYREGLYFTLPSGNWSVVEACSGVRYIIASVTVGALFAYLTYVTWWRRALFLLCSAIVPVFANTLRAYLIVMLGHFSDMQLATGADHLVYGWVFFGIVIFILFWIGSFFQEEPVSVAKLAAEEAGRSEQGAPRSRLVITLLLALVAVSLSPVAIRVLGLGTAAQSPLAPAMITATDGWHRLDTAAWSWQPAAMVGGLKRAFFQRDEFLVSVEFQYADAGFALGEVVGSSRFFNFPNDPWHIIERNKIPVSNAGAEFAVDEVAIRGPSGRYLAWSWYELGGLRTSNDYLGKIQEAAASFGLAQPGATRVLLVTPLGLDSESSRVQLQTFLQAHGQLINDQLRRGDAGGS